MSTKSFTFGWSYNTLNLNLNRKLILLYKGCKTLFINHEVNHYKKAFKSIMVLLDSFNHFKERSSVTKTFILLSKPCASLIQ